MAQSEFDDRIDESLRRGLSALDAPEPSPSFDGSVLGALRRPGPAGRAWGAARPVLASGALGLLTTLLLLRWALAAPIVGRLSAAGPAMAADALDRAMAGAELRSGSLAAVLRAEASAPPAKAPGADRHDGDGATHSQSHGLRLTVG